jgi:butyrate response factor
MRLDLVGKLAARKRRMSSLSACSSSCMELDPLCSIATSEVNSDNSVDATSETKNGVNAARYKTELCRSFSENGYCRYGDKCQFAHGGVELRRTSRHPRYKTELCKAYHMSGFCPYGARYSYN